MRRKLHLYLPFINAGLHEAITYRINWFFLIFGNILGCFVSYFVWNAVFLSSGESIMNGFTMSQMVVYIFLMFLTSTVIKSGVTYDIGEEIRDGTIAMRLIKPISYNCTFLFQELGNKIITVCIIVPPIVIGVEICRAVMMDSIQFNILSFLLYIISCVFAYFINFFFNICFGFVAFFIKHLWGANMMKNAVIGFLSGVVVPISFLPETLGNILLFLPFSSLNYTPVMIYMSVYSGKSIVFYMGLQLIWAFLFWALSKLLWKLSTKHICVQGG